MPSVAAILALQNRGGLRWDSDSEFDDSDNFAPRLGLTWAFFFGPVLSVLVLVLPWTRRQRGVRLALAGLGVFLLAAAVTSPLHPHYAAPFTGLAFLVVTAAVRTCSLKVGRLAGRRSAACRSRRPTW